ncbi:MAG: efflux RND transporter periplasmic adaptor subunit [Chloroflexi bacterium]|nr:efflux RND transporter periplasmic adaptor subunit [Chloroflexota bacterium]
MKKTIYIVIGLVAVLAIAAILYLVVIPSSSAVTLPEDVETTQIITGPVSEIVGATGTVSSNQSATLDWKTSGIVAETYFQVGDVVQTGEVLAVLDQSSLSPVDILAGADLVNAQRALDELLESQVQSARAMQAVETAQEALDEARNPELAQAAALQAIAEAEKAVDDADRKLKILTAPVSQSALEQAQANLVLAEKKLNDNQEMIERIQKKMGKRDDQFKPWESRSRYKKILEGLEMQRIQLQISFENSQQKYLDLQTPPNPNDVAVAEANLLDAQAQLFEAERDWERIKDGTSPADLALLEAQLSDAQREWERVKDGPAAEDVAAAQAQVAAAQTVLDKTKIVAPFAGTITEVISKTNDQVTPATPAFRLDDLSNLWVDVGVSEIDINLVEVGQPVILTFDGILAKEYQGKVVEVSPVGSTNLGVVDFKVTIELLDADADVRPGMTAAVEIVVSPIDEALLVPSRSMT